MQRKKTSLLFPFPHLFVHLVLAVFSVCLVSFQPVALGAATTLESSEQLKESTPSELLKPLHQVGFWGVGNVEAAQVWNKVKDDQSVSLEMLLSEFDRATPLSGNGLRTLIEARLEQELKREVGGQVGLANRIATLKMFALNPDHAPLGRTFALDLLERYVPEEIEPLHDLLLKDPEGEMRRPAIARLIEEAKKIVAENQPDSPSKAVAVYRTALKSVYDYDQLDFIVNAIGELNEKGQLGLTFDPALARGFLVNWQVIGPFDNTDCKGFDTVYAPETDVWSNPPESGKTYTGKHGEVAWKPARPTDPYAVLQFNDLLIKEKFVCAYATTEIESFDESPVTLRIASYNALKIWINGQRIDSIEIYHGDEQPDQYVYAVTLPKGKSRLLFKVCQNNQPQEYTWEWRLKVRIRDERGRRKGQEEIPVLQETEQIFSQGTPNPVAPGLENWSHFRGPRCNPALEKISTTLAQSLESLDESKMAWKTALPGTGPSSPVLVGDLVIVTAATGSAQQNLHTIAIDAQTGEKRWERTLRATGPTSCQEFGGIAANSPASDGNRIIVQFSSNDVACFDRNGNLLWLRGLALERPKLRIDTGMSSSPLLLGNVLVVQCVSQGEAFLAGLDLESGVEFWRLPRTKEQIWSSPAILVLPEKGGWESPVFVLATARDQHSVIDPKKGRLVAEYKTESTAFNTIVSPVAVDDSLFVQMNAVHKIDFPKTNPSGIAGAKEIGGEQDKQIQNESVLNEQQRIELEPVWVEPALRINNPSPVISEGKLYSLKDPGILVCSDVESGKTIWQIRLEGPFWATPVVLGNYLIAVNHGGLVQVVHIAGSKGNSVGKLQLEGHGLATPAANSENVYLRTNQFLLKIE